MKRRRHDLPDETPSCCMCGMVHIAGDCVRFEHFLKLLAVVQHKVDRLLAIERKRRH